MGIVGTLILPGDKSISHRALMLASISNKKSKLINLSTGKDVSSTISCLKNCGIEINKNGKDITIQGGTLRDPKNVLDCGNSGTTIRLLAGLLAGQGINATLVGDKSLSKRPMRRIIDPLMKMGVKISSKNNFAPITIEQSKMNPINYYSPIASAQVKSCILFAGMGVEGLTQINEPFQSRDHSEIMLQHLGASINVSKDGVSISKSDIQNPIDLTIPSDPSTAAFFIAASLMCKDSKLIINRLLLNETRIGFIKAVTQMGGNIKFLKTWVESGEIVGNIQVEYSQLKGITIDENQVPSIIDELPIFAILATQAKGVTVVRGAKELRNKESDRIAAICKNLKLLGADIDELDDGFKVGGSSKLRGVSLKTYDDHRIAMGFAVAELVADGNINLDNPDCISISFPEFFSTLESITKC